MQYWKQVTSRRLLTSDPWCAGSAECRVQKCLDAELHCW